MDSDSDDRLAASEAGRDDMERRLYESLISHTPDLIYAFDLDYRFTFANRALLDMWDRTFEESVGKRLLDVGYEPWHAEMHEREIDEVVATKKSIRGEVGFPHATLGWRVYDYIFSPVMNEAGEVEWISGSTRDITELKNAQDHLQLVLNELNHRVKNTLATIQSIAAQTFRKDAAREDLAADFEARLLGLSNAHNILTRTNWESADLHALAAQALAPFQVDGDSSTRIEISGGSVELGPRAALSIAMALHELASNAVKYGALSSGRGQVDLTWSRDDGDLLIEWRERGGPLVEPPASRGFGSRLIERGLARELDGTVDLEFHPSGVACHIRFPLAEAVTNT